MERVAGTASRPRFSGKIDKRPRAGPMARPRDSNVHEDLSVKERERVV